MLPFEFMQWLNQPDRRPLVMGVLNVTPDSFSDGGRFAEPGAAVAHAREMVRQGAAIIDVGGESTRPGSERVPAHVQIVRVIPVILALAAENLPCTISIDTTLAPVAQAALDAGATIINDISGSSDDPGMLPLAARTAAPIVLMHMQGQPATMQLNPTYADVVEDVATALGRTASAARAAGVREDRILLDPGIGFGKKIDHNLALLRNLSRFARLGYPLVLGTSRKGFLGRITGESEPSGRVMATAGSVAWCVANGAAVVRVHDVEPMARVVRIVRAIRDGIWDE
ncbi:MAG TPA: dihydropteroate synthase [Tepidisphaeraceae bacterium]|nr:dihydropteroate synthase [Tepidisphaeraceae bacterium]